MKIWSRDFDDVTVLELEPATKTAIETQVSKMDSKMATQQEPKRKPPELYLQILFHGLFLLKTISLKSEPQNLTNQDTLSETESETVPRGTYHERGKPPQTQCALSLRSSSWSQGFEGPARGVAFLAKGGMSERQL